MHTKEIVTKINLILCWEEVIDGKEILNPFALVRWKFHNANDTLFYYVLKNGEVMNFVNNFIKLSLN